MSLKAIVSRKGQVTIPKVIRTRLGLAPGTVLEFEAESGALVARKTEKASDPVLAVTGIIERPVDVEAYLETSRGPVK